LPPVKREAEVFGGHKHQNKSKVGTERREKDVLWGR
jgi:hypothetical protein